jgi:hypothetical protein
VRYGLNKQDGIELRKTEDVLQFNSALGYRKDTLSNWYHTAKFNFNTQFTDGYAYPNTEVSISKRFARLYFLRTWSRICHKDKQKLLYISLYIQNNNGTGPEHNQGAFGVKKHCMMRMEI